MSTVNNVFVPNYPPSTSTNCFNHIWKLSRALKKAGWKYIASSNNATKDVSKDPAGDLWNIAPGTTNVGAPTSAVVASPSRGRAIVTGLTSIVAADKGRFLTLTGSGTAANNHAHQIEEIISSTSVAIDARTFAVAADATGRTWSIVDYNQDTYVGTTLATPACWWLAKGPVTLKIPYSVTITPGSTGLKYIRGENVVQSSTGAEGEVIGYVENGASSYITIAPRRRGVGSGVYGWDTGNNITGSYSGAFTAQNGTGLEYRHEVVFWKAAAEITGSIFVSTVEPVGDTTFESLISTAGCTLTVAPGGGGTGNTFPTFAWLVLGQTTSGTHNSWTLANNGTIGNLQAVVVDCIEEQNYSADGSWFHSVAQTGQAGTIGYSSVTFQRMDDTEPGDVDPYLTFGPGQAATIYSNSRTTYGNTVTGLSSSLGGVVAASSSVTMCRGWRGRGTAGDSATNSQDYECSYPACGSSSIVHSGAGSTSVTTVVTAPTQTKAGFPLLFVSTQITRRQIKGKSRYLTWVDGGNVNTTYNNKLQMQLSSDKGAFIIMWDGITSPYSQNT